MKFIYPAVFRKTDKGTYKGFSQIWKIVSEKETLWMRQSKKQTQLLTTGSPWNLMRMTVSFHRFLMKMIWILRKVTLSETFLSISASMRDGMNKISSLDYFH